MAAGEEAEVGAVVAATDQVVAVAVQAETALAVVEDLLKSHDFLLKIMAVCDFSKKPLKSIQRLFRIGAD